MNLTVRLGFFAAITGLALLLRIWAAGRQDIWHDEAISLLVARLPLAELIRFTAHDVHPPLYYALLKLWLLPGESVEWAQAFGIVTGLPFVLLTLALANRWLGWRPALVAGTLAAIAPFPVLYSVEIRMYGLVLTLATATVLAYDATRRDAAGSRYWPVALALVGAALLYTAYAGGLVLIMLSIHFVLSRRPTTNRLDWRAPAGLTGAFVLFLPWVGILAQQAGRVAQGYWIAPPPPLAPLFSYTSFLIGYSQPLQLRIAGLFLTLAFLALSFRVLGLDAWRDPIGVRLAFLWLLLPPLGALALSAVQPIYLDRIVLIAAPAWYILVAGVIGRKAGDWPVRVLAAGLAGLIVISLYGYGYVAGYQKAPMRAAAAWLSSRWQPGDVVLHTSSGSRFPFAVYAPELPQSLVPDDPVSVQVDAPSQSAQRLAGNPIPLDEAVQNGQRLWLIVALDHSIEHQIRIRDQAHATYRLEEAASIGNIGLYLFDLSRSSGGSS